MTLLSSNDRSTQSPKRLQIGVIGCGAMGRNHARLCSDLKGVELGVIVETSPERRALAAQQFACPVYSDVSELDFDKIDAFCISVPTIHHRDIASLVINQEKPCLIEKPLAADIESCRALIDLQWKKKVPVLVGHVERFNPAFVQLKSILRNEQVIGIDAQRLSYATIRSQDIDVVMDLMIHDIDIILALLGKDEVVDIQAQGFSLTGTGPDYAVAILRSEQGKIVTLTASRVTNNKLRLLQATTANAHIQVDYTDQKIDIHRRGRIRVADAQIDPHYSIETSVEKVIVRHNEPLANELQHFFACVRGVETPRVSPSDAMKAIELAHQIQHCISKVATHDRVLSAS